MRLTLPRLPHPRSLRSSVAGAMLAAALLIAIGGAFIIGLYIPRPQPAGAPATASAGAAATMYTCSMHPQVRLPDPDAKCPICFMDLIPATDDDDGDGGPPRLAMSAAAAALAEIRTAPVLRDYPVRTVRLFGRVDYDETRVATIAAWFPGRLERLYVDYTGMTVRARDHLATIYSPALISAQEELQQAAAAAQSVAEGSPSIRGATRATLEAVREKLRLWGLTAEQIEQMERSVEPLEELTIHAPTGGVVTHKNVVEGDYVETGEELFRIAELDHLWLRLEAYESQLPWIRYGQAVTFTTESVPGETFHGRIAFVDPAVDPRTRTVRVRLNVENDARRLKPGMFVRAAVRSTVAGAGLVMSDDLAGKWISPMHPEVIKDEPGTCDVCGMPLVRAEELGYVAVNRDAPPPLIIPETAPLITGRRAVVYVAVPDAPQPTFEGREVILGPRADGVYIVREGLVESEHVVVNGAFKIDSAMQIAAKPSMMSGDAAPPPAEAHPPLPALFAASLEPLYAHYFEAQEALAADDLAAFAEAATAFAEARAAVPAQMLHGELLGRWRRAAAALPERGDLPGAIGDDIETARIAFEPWARAMIELERAFGHAAPRTWYVSFCPMAFSKRGAPWLARQEQIANPYFGASMLRCGTVQQQRPPRGDAAPEAAP